MPIAGASLETGWECFTHEIQHFLCVYTFQSNTLSWLPLSNVRRPGWEGGQTMKSGSIVAADEEAEVEAI